VRPRLSLEGSAAPKPFPPEFRRDVIAVARTGESFFALLQKNVVDRQPRATREDLRLAISTWIGRIYHRRRRRLRRLTTIEYETLHMAATAA
jgi:hypothetical protein